MWQSRKKWKNEHMLSLAQWSAHEEHWGRHEKLRLSTGCRRKEIISVFPASRSSFNVSGCKCCDYVP